MAGPRKRTLPRKPAPEAVVAPAEPPRPVAVVDIGASAIRLVVADVTPGRPPQILEDASRGVLLGKDTFTHGRIGPATIESTLKALEGFRRIMDSYGVARYRAVATSAVREAANRETFIDRVRLRTGIDVEIIDGSEENRLTYMAVRESLRGKEGLLSADAVLAEIGGGSADISLLRRGEPIRSGTYALGSIRMRQSLASWHGSHEQRVRLLRRHVHNVVEDIRNEMPLREARWLIALGGDMRFAATRILGEPSTGDDAPSFTKDAFLAFCDDTVGNDVEELVDRYHLPQADAETLVPALLAYRELLVETSVETIVVLASAAALGEKYRYDGAHAKHVAFLATRVFDDLRAEHGLAARDRLLLEVAALLHDIGIYVSLRGHHKHSLYLLSVSEIFGLSRDDMAVVANVARYHRRATPQKSHIPYMSLDRDTRVVVNKLAAILRVANALDADHLQKVKDVRVVSEEESWVLEVEGAGDLTMERLATLSRADYLTDVFGQRVAFREGGGR
jgi:exopolyphosphatase/guanosine-5'-triphosphate,3'-diphosphate pyrophosphatase